MTASRPSLSELFGPDEFVARHIGTLDAGDRRSMLDTIGVQSVEELIDETVPESIRLRGQLDLPDAMSEANVTAALRALAARNRPRRSMIGMGYTGT
ncbi:MAG: hypothetical protein F2562_09550, partial [Actinobacteria bacterium]|nr:hypothetical protein [Actinomycetota bacterium]